MKDMIYNSYQTLTLKIQKMKVIVDNGEENWEDDMKRKIVKNMNLMNKNKLIIKLEKCIIKEDNRIKKIKVNGKINNVEVNIKDERLMDLLNMFQTIKLK
jgi:hypothetical protein